MCATCIFIQKSVNQSTVPIEIWLDGREQCLLQNIFKIGQKSLSKLFMTFQQTLTCSKSTRETLEVDLVLKSLF